MKTEEIIIERFITKEEERQYFMISFSVPEDVERLRIHYEYPRFKTGISENGFTTQTEINIIDLGLSGISGEYIGSSGSNRSEIEISASNSSQGFANADTKAGEWSIMAGAYKIQEEGVMVTYHITFYKKELLLLKGDTHLHTLGSDGNLSAKEIAECGQKQNLDYLILTDHNNYSHNFSLPETDNLTLIPGMEWTHYNGHAGMLGIKKPVENAFCVNSPEEMTDKLNEARNNQAKIVLNHPFCPNCGWKWGIEHTPFDMIEIWNGATPPAVTADCLSYWDHELKKGKHIPVIGGSDFHKTEYLRMVASPCTCVYAMSRSGEDIINALSLGHCYMTASPDGPDLSMTTGEISAGETPPHVLGDTVVKGSDVHIHLWNLKEHDLILLITDETKEEIPCPASCRDITLTRSFPEALYVRIEIWRIPLPGLPKQLSLISNPIYFK